MVELDLPLGDDEETVARPTAGAVVRLSPRSRVAPGDILKLVVDTSAIHLFDLATGATVAGSV